MLIPITFCKFCDGERRRMSQRGNGEREGQRGQEEGVRERQADRHRERGSEKQTDRGKEREGERTRTHIHVCCKWLSRHLPKEHNKTRPGTHTITHTHTHTHTHHPHTLTHTHHDKLPAFTSCIDSVDR